LLILTFVVSTLYITASAGSLAYGAATVGATSLNIRTGPDTKYPIVLTVDHNEKIVILEKTNSDWFHVAYGGSFGYVASMYLTDILVAENFTAVGKLVGDDVFMRAGPSTSEDTIGTVGAGTTVNIIGINNGWYKVVFNGKTGYIRSDFITIISNGKTNTAPPAGVSAVAGVKETSKSQAPLDNIAQLSSEQLTARQQLIDYALQFVGGSYVYGGNSPSTGFDCSGLVHYVYGHFSYSLTRSASSQYNKDGTSISKADLLPGDLVFFSSNGGYSVTHVGIYIGNNQFVHASCPKLGIVVSDLGSNYYTNVWYGAKRILA
jgi:cell wall-associated NlpC family hydrolase